MRPPDRNIFRTVGGVDGIAAQIKIWHEFGHLKKHNLTGRTTTITTHH
jgi:hypothetical protein